ncbi:MAG: DNA repair protein RecN [Chloroflexi bacterium]|nr:DNA repair protein RecN [Chloroflexota bacterium]
MLEELRIQNFAVIDRLELSFSAGFNVITGETGAGKSILVDAVELLLGARADPIVVRAGSERSRVEGLFKLDSRSRLAVLPLLEREDLVDEDEPEYLSIMREVRRRGRSSARINGIPVRSEVLSQIGGALVDIHGQSQHLSLFRPRHHIDLLDRYADLLDLREGLASMVAELTGLQAEMRRLRDDEETLARRAALLRHELEEIRAAELDPAEERNLLAERNRLANSEQLANLATEALQLLNGDESGRSIPAVDGLMSAAAALAKLARIDPAMTEHHALAEDLAQATQDLALTLTRYANDVEFDPQRLDELEGRLELITTLKRRFRAESIDELLAYAERAAAELAGLDASDERLGELGRREDQLMRQIGDVCRRLSRARAEASAELSRAVLRELADLRMERSRFEVLLQQAEHPSGCIIGDRRYKFDAKGMDDVEFMLSANPGEPPRPLAKVASGGEAARIMLALKRVLTAADQTPILIFDEVDQGIGGRIGAVVGEKLWSLSGEHQVLCVTHLPQLAGYADRHFQAQKAMSDEAAATRVRVLEDEAERVAELAAMLGTAGAAGMQSARELLAAARERKAQLLPPPHST